MSKYRFIDLFAGIGGFHIAFHRQNCDCVFASEINEFARKTYEHNLKKYSPNLFKNNNFNSDILSIPPEKIPEFDILCAGFPCQPFSQAGYKRGFQEGYQNRGNMFFIIRDIIKTHRPKAIFLENVRHLEKHDDGRTFRIIREIIEDELGYSFYYKLVKASDFGLPQHRPRLFMIGFRKEDAYPAPFEFPNPTKLKMTMSDIWGAPCTKKVGFTLRVGGRGSDINDRRNWDSYMVDGEVKRLSPKEGRKMMGFPDDYEFPVSAVQAMKQLGNSVAVPAIEAVARTLVEYLNSPGKKPMLELDFETGILKTSFR